MPELSEQIFALTRILVGPKRDRIETHLVFNEFPWQTLCGLKTSGAGWARTPLATPDCWNCLVALEEYLL